MEQKITSTIRLRMSSQDAHYGGNLVDGAHMLALFGDVATELLIKCDGDEGLFKAYDMVEFIAPVYAGDYIEAYLRNTHPSLYANSSSLVVGVCPATTMPCMIPPSVNPSPLAFI